MKQLDGLALQLDFCIIFSTDRPRNAEQQLGMQATQIWPVVDKILPGFMVDASTLHVGLQVIFVTPLWTATGPRVVCSSE